MTTTKKEEFDVIIIGAGISGISAAYHLQQHCPDKTFRLVERRWALGGTWDLFRYPGIRSDSDMYTFGFSFRPWRSADQKVIAAKDDILNYLKETVEEYGIDEHIQYGTSIQQASWDSVTAHWTLTGVQQDLEEGTASAASTVVIYKAHFVFLCSGYYDYDQGYAPKFPGQESFQGPIVHPQHWPRDLNYTDKRVVVIGSGATAITLIPSLLSTNAGNNDGPASHVTMLQRSPTYLAARPAKMTLVTRLVTFWLGHHVTRWFYILDSIVTYSFCRFFPNLAKRFLLSKAKAAVGDDIFRSSDFSPRYDPWDQRICLCPDSDFSRHSSLAKRVL